MSLREPLWLLAGVPLAVLWWRFLAQPRGRWLRLAVLGCLTIALAEPALRDARRAPPVTLVVDRSSSVRGQALREAGAVLADLAASGARDTSVVGFGLGAAVLVDSAERASLPTDLAMHDESDVAAGLRLAAAASDPNDGRNVLLISDGQFTGPDPRREIPFLRDRGVRVTYDAIEPRRRDEVAVARVVAPSQVVVGQAFSVGVEIASATERPGSLVVRDERDREIARHEVTLDTGTTPFSLQVTPTAVGIRTYEVSIEIDGDDEIAENDRARVAVDVSGPPRILLLNQSGRESALARSLARAGTIVDTLGGSLRLTSAMLRPYEAVVLENMPLQSLGDGADAALAHYVTFAGGGLLVTGGKHSYANGGYYKSFLEEILPLRMDNLAERIRPHSALGIAIDRSGSMRMPAGDGASKIDLANRAAAEAIALLDEDDEVTVLAVDSQAQVVVPLQAIGGAERRAQIAGDVLRIDAAGGGIFVYEALRTAVKELSLGSSQARHLILFADAADAEEPGDFRPLVGAWRDAGCTLSVVGLGQSTDSDADLLAEIAALGNGRLFFTSSALNLPRIFAQDVIEATRRTFVEEAIPLTAAPGLLSLEMKLDAPAAVGGYNVSELSPGADLLWISQSDPAVPLAAAWRRGTGRVVAIAAEADGAFSGGLAEWTGYQTFFREIVEWLKRVHGEGAVADLSLAGHKAIVSLELEPGLAVAGQPSAVLFTPDGIRPRPVPLRWVGPTQLIGETTLASDGIYHGVVELPGGPPLLLPPRVLPYSPEFAPGVQGIDGTRVLREIAAATGGEPFTHVDQLLRGRNTGGARSLALWFAALALLGAITDIGNRRGLWDPALARLARRTRALPRPRWRPSSPPPPVASARVPTPAADTPPVAPVDDDGQNPGNAILARAKERARRRL